MNRDSIKYYGLKDYYNSHQTPTAPSWKDQDINIDIDPLSINKSMYDPGQLKATYGLKMNSLWAILTAFGQIETINKDTSS